MSDKLSVYFPTDNHAIRDSAPAVYSSPFIERVWANGEVYREAYAISTPEGAAIVNQFLSNFPTETAVTENALNWVGVSAGGIREPYDNNTYSTYLWKNLPAELAEGFSCSEYYSPRAVTMPWFGLKYDSQTKRRVLKIPYWPAKSAHPEAAVHTPRPSSIPANSYEFYGKLYYEDGTVDPNIDCYIATEVQTMRDFCTKVGIQFPVPDDHLEHVNLWGIVYNSETLEITMVKAYEIVPYSS